MFVVVAVLGVLVGWGAWNLHQVQERERTLAWLDSQGIMYGKMIPRRHQRQLPLVWMLCGVQPVDLIELPIGDITDRQASDIRALFPEADVVMVPPLVDIPPDQLRAIESPAAPDPEDRLRDSR